MTTARDLITIALQHAGVTGMGLTPSAADINGGFTLLQDMIAQWQINRWLVYHLVATDLPMTGAVSYTVGIIPGGPASDYNIERPDRLEDARVIWNSPGVPNDVGRPLKILSSMEGYNRIRLQHLGSLPLYAFYDSDYPVGKVYYWPLPSSLYTCRIITKAVLQQFANLNDVVNLPLEYYRAIRFNLQDELLSAYKFPPDPTLHARAVGALNAIRNANLQLPTLVMPEDLQRHGRYNIYSDNTV